MHNKQNQNGEDILDETHDNFSSQIYLYFRVEAQYHNTNAGMHEKHTLHICS